LSDLGRSTERYTYAVFHQPNAKFPQAVAKRLGFSDAQIAPGLLSPQIGNTYSGAALMGLCATLDVAQPGDTIFLCSYGSGAGSDAYSLIVTEALLERRTRAALTAAYLQRSTFIDYAVYAKWRGKLVTR
jgi:hydroxymethylglutaryl-CoA synthase